jgi:hypothetical protein
MGRKERDELRIELERLLADPTKFLDTVHLPGYQAAKVTGVLVRSVLLLDRSSEWLAKVNIGLAGVLVVIGLLQICLVVRGR